MSRRAFAHRAETFGFDTSQPWALDALRLLFHVPRVYAPLVTAWDVRHPGSRKALDRLTDAGFVAHQPAIIADVRSGERADGAGRSVPRYRATSKGRRLVLAAREDIRYIEDVFQRVPLANTYRVASLLEALHLDDGGSRFGLSCAHAAQQAGMPERTCRWWLARLEQAGYVKRLAVTFSDRREVVAEHWRITRLLCRQLSDVLDAYDSWSAIRGEFRLGRTRFLDDIDPDTARIGLSGATDYDHDVETQRVLARLLASPACVAGGRFDVEPRIVLTADVTERPWRFTDTGNGTVFYQPDAVVGELNGTVRRRSVVEYERFQSRRDAWGHIERFCGWVVATMLPFEAAALRFVVDSDARMRGYVQLIEAFGDYALDHPERMPPNPILLCVTSVKRLAQVPDALADSAWIRLALPTSDVAGGRTCVVHAPDDSPYDSYFAKGG